MRALIVALFAVLVMLPFMLGVPLHRPSSTSRTMSTELADLAPQIPGTPAHWADFVRTLVATLIGAGIAFATNLHLQRRARRLDQIAAANAAGATLARQYNTFMNVRKAVAAELAAKEDLAPTTPMWFFARPFLHHLRDDLEIDFDKLTFIFEIGDVDTFQKLHLAQAAYDELLGYLDRLEKLCMEKQERFEAAGFVMHDLEVTAEQAIATAGPRLIGQLEPIIEAIQRQCAEDGPRYLEASHALHRSAATHFGKGVRMIRVVE